MDSRRSLPLFPLNIQLDLCQLSSGEEKGSRGYQSQAGTGPIGVRVR
jgi:hypothetical protein